MKIIFIAVIFLYILPVFSGALGASDLNKALSLATKGYQCESQAASVVCESNYVSNMVCLFEEYLGPKSARCTFDNGIGEVTSVNGQVADNIIQALIEVGVEQNLKFNLDTKVYFINSLNCTTILSETSCELTTSDGEISVFK